MRQQIICVKPCTLLLVRELLPDGEVVPELGLGHDELASAGAIVGLAVHAVRLKIGRDPLVFGHLRYSTGCVH